MYLLADVIFSNDISCKHADSNKSPYKQQNMMMVVKHIVNFQPLQLYGFEITTLLLINWIFFISKYS